MCVVQVIGILLIFWPSTRATPRRGMVRTLGKYVAQFRATHLISARVLGVALVSAVASSAIAFGIFGIPMLAILVAGAAFCLVVAAILRRSKRLRESRRAAWPEVIDYLISCVRAGVSPVDSLAGLADHGPAQFRAEFRNFDRDLNCSGSTEYALSALQDRLADPVADKLIEFIRIARRTGSPGLVNVLQSFSALLRQDLSAQSEVGARASWITNSARLAIVAPWLVLLLVSSTAEGRAAYSTGLGSVVMLLGALMCLVAYVLMRNIARIRQEHRWL